VRAGNVVGQRLNFNITFEYNIADDEKTLTLRLLSIIQSVIA
jgi:hypothetical protein